MIEFICYVIPLVAAWRIDYQSKLVAGKASLETVVIVQMKDDGGEILGGSNRAGKKQSDYGYIWWWNQQVRLMEWLTSFSLTHLHPRTLSMSTKVSHSLGLAVHHFPLLNWTWWSVWPPFIFKNNRHCLLEEQD